MMGRPVGIVELFPRKRRTDRQSELGADKRKWLQSLKVERGCMDCGYNEHAVALDFDHRPGTTKARILSGKGLVSLGWGKLMEEIAKCDVVCANCHRVRTAERGDHLNGTFHEKSERRRALEG